MYLGPGLGLAPHFNIATTIVVSLAEDFSLKTWSQKNGWSDWYRSTVVVIPSETLHHLVSTGPMAFLYLDPLGDGRLQINQSQLEQGRLRLIQESTFIGLHSAFDGFGLISKKPRDARIAKVVLAIERQPNEFQSLQDAAAISCLSPSRFRARFAQEIGLPFRRYRLWRRMACVMKVIAEGGNLTEAAHRAGFSSSAHLSSAFKQMFGISASDVLAIGVAIDVSEDVSHLHTQLELTEHL